MFLENFKEVLEVKKKKSLSYYSAYLLSFNSVLFQYSTLADTYLNLNNSLSSVLQQLLLI